VDFEVLYSAGARMPSDPRRRRSAGWVAPILGLAFLAIAIPVLAGAGVVTLLGERAARRVQGPRRRPALVIRGLRDTAIAAWMAAAFAAWPVSRVLAGRPIGLVWSSGEAGGLALALGQTAVAVLALDAWLYWKHRLLHTRWLFGFHRAHHAYRDPTAFAGFAVGPVESLLTFWPIVLVAIPQARHWAPLYFTLVGSFILLNFYLHCGAVSRLLEATLPRLLLNTSVFHNVHHANAEVNFGEAMIAWDRICGTQDRALPIRDSSRRSG
jgi:lathosterol oxidase